MFPHEIAVYAVPGCNPPRGEKFHVISKEDVDVMIGILEEAIKEDE